MSAGLRFRCVLVLAHLDQAASAVSLRQMLDRVWTRSPQAQTALARSEEFKARKAPVESQ